MKLLFFPSDQGGGCGHVSRCRAVAHAARKRGHDCAFVLNAAKYRSLIEKDFPVYMAGPNRLAVWAAGLAACGRRLARWRAQPQPALFTEFSSLDYQVIRDGLVSTGAIRAKLEQYRAIVAAFRPHVLVGDTNLLVGMLGHCTGVPVVQIVRYATHPKTARLIWWKDIGPELVPPCTAPVFNRISEHLRVARIEKAEDLLHGERYLVPSTPEIEPVPPDATTAHVGALTLQATLDNQPAWMRQLDTDTPVVYITIGGGAGQVGTARFFETVLEAFRDSPLQIVVSTSVKFKNQAPGATPRNISFFDWVPGPVMIQRADLVVFHGGYGTMMEILSSGKPSLTIPYHSEQEGNGRRLQAFGCGCVRRLSLQEPRQVMRSWPHGGYTFLVQDRYDLCADDLRQDVSALLDTEYFRGNAVSLQKKMREHGGTERALQEIEQLV